VKPRELRKGMSVFWRDPEGTCSGYGTVVDLPPLAELNRESIIGIKKADGGYVEAYPAELDNAE
jgi:hypothetical protein